MEEKRRAPRIKEENEVTITVVSGGKNIPEEINDNHTKDISVCGANIQTNIPLPVNTLVELDFTSKGVRQQMKILGKVKWVKSSMRMSLMRWLWNSTPARKSRNLRIISH